MVRPSPAGETVYLGCFNAAGLPEDGKPGQALLERLRATPAPR